MAHKTGKRVTMKGDTKARGWRKRVVVPDGMEGTVGNVYGIFPRAYVVKFSNGYTATVTARHLRKLSADTPER
jgi:hypothetical protein